MCLMGSVQPIRKLLLALHAIALDEIRDQMVELAGLLQEEGVAGTLHNHKSGTWDHLVNDLPVAGRLENVLGCADHQGGHTDSGQPISHVQGEEVAA